MILEITYHFSRKDAKEQSRKDKQVLCAFSLTYRLCVKEKTEYYAQHSSAIYCSRNKDIGRFK